MDTDNQRDDSSPYGSVKSQPPMTYSFLLKLSRQLGSVATHSSFLHDVRSFLNQEVALPSSEKLFTTVSQRKNDATIKNDQRRSENRSKDLRKIVERSHEVLVSINTIFPISLFPDTVTVDRTKVTIVKRDFFWSSDVMSIRIEDVLNVSSTVGPVFGSLTVASRVMSTVDHFKINHFWRNDAIYLKRIIQGYVIAQHNNIDTAHLEKKELIETLIELGEDSN